MSVKTNPCTLSSHEISSSYFFQWMLPHNLNSLQEFAHIGDITSLVSKSPDVKVLAFQTFFPPVYRYKLKSNTKNVKINISQSKYKYGTFSVKLCIGDLMWHLEIIFISPAAFHS